MLVTTCPECDTTFRINAGILEQAGGQARCGHCGHIFDANASLREHADVPTRSIHEIESGLGTETDEPAMETAGIIGEPDVVDGPAAVDEILAGNTEIEPDTEPERETAPEHETGPEYDTGITSGIPAESAAGTAPGETGNDSPDPAWLPPLRQPGPRRRWPWAAGAGLLALALAVQLIHQFRDTLGALPAIGEPLQQIYAGLGLPAPRSVDLEQYELLDLTAVADPVTEEQGWLIIETRVQNTGPDVQPVPYIFVALLDRWQETIAGRYFSPEEYMVTPESDVSRMSVGNTIDAQFIIVDPGPGATGFELQICTPVEQGFVCDGQPVFD